MKNILYISFLIIGSSVAFGQVNLVPNPSFEDTVACPFSSGDIDMSTGWTTYCGSPDFFNSCNQFDWGVPNNIFGYQEPASGNAYAGFATFSSDLPDSREFPVCNLTSPLSIGTKYYVSFKVSLSLNSISLTNSASNNIGAMFSTGYFPCNITNNPPVYVDTIITDTSNWVRVTGSFVADSTYSVLLIGNFFSDANTDTTMFYNEAMDNAYYYLDDVCVGTDSAFVYNYDPSAELEENDLSNQFFFSPNPARHFLNIQSDHSSPFDIHLYDALGNLLYSEADISINDLQLNISQYENGLLFLKITSNNNQLIHKFLKQ